MNNKQQLSSLQAIRGLAAILVLVAHATAILHLKGVSYVGGIFSEGRIGVDLFFVLSGFIIFYIHHKDKNQNGLPRKFFIKRFIRIFPIYWITLILLIPFELLIPDFGIGPQVYSQLGTHIKAIFLFPQEGQPLTVAWTLTSEIIFYFIFGAVLFSKFRKSAIAMFSIWMLLSALTIIYEPTNYVILCLFYPANVEFLYGMIVAYLVLNYKVKMGPLLILIGAVCSILAMYNAINGFIVINRMFAFGIPSAILILGCVSLEFSKQIRIPRIFTYLGDASYSIYLTHFPALFLLYRVFINHGLHEILDLQWVMTLIVLITIIFGCLFHSIIEKPLLKILRKSLLPKKTNRVISA